MINIIISGGLGNQLFQYAAGWSLANRLGVGLRIDTRFYTEYEGPRSFRLSMLPISAEIKSYRERGIFRAHGIVYRMKRILWDKWIYDLYNEPCLGFDPGFFELSDGVWVSGLFQSYRYIDFCSDIRSELSIESLVSSGVKSDHYSRYISLHVRRGDYTSLPGFWMEYFDKYYSEAMRRASVMFGCDRFLVFSDDVQWCKSQSLFQDNCDFFEDSSYTDIDALYAMGECKGHVIANSSFSLWAALMSGKGGVAPSKWIKGVDTREAEIVPSEGWVLI